ncbi:MAG: efflux RND transporter permease subunit [Lachnospiraceae bacterium]|nr:efflux RND transporter permease subunit [Lachnospiraceae bacterium]
MTKFFVKKPYFILVIIVVVLTIGGVSLSKMRSDLMPEFELPYLAVIVTEPGATPEKVENDATKLLESKLGTVNGVENIQSTSSSNYAMVMLEFADDTEMDSAMVRVSQALDSIELPEGCGKPNMMEISMDMMATMYASVDYDGKDIKDLSQFVTEVVQPYIERQEGVASVSASGLIEDTLEIRLNQKKIDEINDKILGKTNSKIEEASKEIDDAEDKLKTGREEINKQKEQLQQSKSETNDNLADSTVKVNEAIATKAAYAASLTSLQASKTALEAEKKAYDDAKIEANYKKIDEGLATMAKQMKPALDMMKVKAPDSIESAVNDKKSFEAFVKAVTDMGYGEQVSEMTYDNIKQVYDIVNTRIPQLEAGIANLDVQIKAAEAVVAEIDKQMGDIGSSASDLYSGSYTATSQFGSAEAQLAAAESQLESGEKELENAKKQLEDSREAAKENANIDALLSLDALSGLIYAQNFSMPAGYVDDKDNSQWLVQVGDNYENVEDIEKMVLTKIKGIGEIAIDDIADVTMIDNQGESYTKINGKDAVLLSIFKASTAGTNDVSDNLRDAFKKLENDHDGLSITPMMDQGDYIRQIVGSVFSSIILGAILAILVLALFLKDVKPTLVVAFSIPFSVLFAIIIMYFTGITINVMSLGGLCLSIGMLVDNSIVVIENIYRLRNRGVSAARAAVQGARQVAAPIIASTVTTIAVFLPMVYTSGTIADLLMPFAFTISYALIASLIVALTVVPTMGSVILKNAKMKEHRIFDKISEVYGKTLQFFLRHKLVPLAFAIVLLIVSTIGASRTGLVLFDDMESNQIQGTLVLPDDVSKEEAYAIADKYVEAICSVKGVAKVGSIDGNTNAAAMSLGSMSGDMYTQFSFIILTEDNVKTTKEYQKIIKDIEKATEGFECEEFSVSSSAMDSMSGLMGGGLSVEIHGDKTEKLLEISKDIEEKLKDVKGVDEIEGASSDDTKELHLVMDKDKIASKGLTVAQIYQAIAGKLTTEKTAITMNINNNDVDVNIVNENDELTYENILNMKVTATTMDETGAQVKKEYKLSKFATTEENDTLDSITRKNQSRYVTVTAKLKEGYNPTLVSRDVKDIIDKYDAPSGYKVEVTGESEQVMDMVWQMLQATALGFLLIYLVMVAQFQSLLSPFIIIFTVPLAFTGGMIGLMVTGRTISAIALMGFMILMGTVVNNGIVFVDYANQLRMKGVEKHTALIATGKTRMRPILMTAMTTILSMSVMVFSQDAGNAMQKSMAIVVASGLIYATFMTLFIVPVMYDILYRKQPKEIDTGSEDLDDILDEASELLEQWDGQTI